MGYVDTVPLAADRSGNRDERGHRTYTQSWLVVFDDLLDSPADALNAPGVASIKGSYPYDPFAVCTSLDVSVVEPYHYKVTAEYKTDVDKEENPLEARAVVSYDFQIASDIVEKDSVTGKAVANTAGDPFDPTLERDKAHLVIRVQRNEASFPVALAASMINKVNAGSWNGFDAKKIRCTNISATEEKAIIADNEFYFYTVNYEFLYDENDHRKKVPNMGFRKLNDEDKPVWIKSEGDNEFITTPVLLSEDGKEVLPPGSEPHVLYFNIYETANFGIFNITL